MSSIHHFPLGSLSVLILLPFYWHSTPPSTGSRMSRRMRSRMSRRLRTEPCSGKIAKCVEFCHMSSGWFDHTEPSLSTTLQGKQGVQGAHGLVWGA